MPLLVLYNPICGDGSAKSFFDTNVLPMLGNCGNAVDEVASTEYAGHAGTIVANFLKSAVGAVTIVLGSGDGTLHDIINTKLVDPCDVQSALQPLPHPELRLVLVPCGTANALYHSLFSTSDTSQIHNPAYRLKSLQSFIAGSKPIPLTLAVTTLSSPPSARNPPTTVISAVVVSTSFHAAILRDSESLRKDMPGLERFKIAAHKNVLRWYKGSVKLLPACSSGVIHIYDSSKKRFVTRSESICGKPTVNLQGPFIYFLSSVNVDRLEHSFRTTPLISKIPPEEASLDVMIVRPERDPSFIRDSQQASAAFEKKIWTVLRGAYQDGIHVDLKYGVNGEIVPEGMGPAVVEYFRCGGWEWSPDEDDPDARLLCADGAIFSIEKGGKAMCVAARQTDNIGFMVFT